MSRAFGGCASTGPGTTKASGGEGVLPANSLEIATEFKPLIKFIHLQYKSKSNLRSIFAYPRSLTNKNKKQLQSLNFALTQSLGQTHISYFYFPKILFLLSNFVSAFGNYVVQTSCGPGGVAQ